MAAEGFDDERTHARMDGQRWLLSRYRDRKRNLFEDSPSSGNKWGYIGYSSGTMYGETTGPGVTNVDIFINLF